MDAADSLKKAQRVRKPHLYVGTCSHSEVSPFYYAVTELSAESNIHAHSVCLAKNMTCKQNIALYLQSVSSLFHATSITAHLIMLLCISLSLDPNASYIFNICKYHKPSGFFTCI